MEDTIMQIIKEVKDLLRDQLVDLWDGTWEREEDHRETFFNLGYWHDLVYKKQFGDHTVAVDCMGYVGPCRITVDLFDGQGEGMLAHLETPQHGFEVDNILCGGREWLEKEFSKHVWEFVNAT